MPFPKGMSGNPTGRPKGLPNKCVSPSYIRKNRWAFTTIVHERADEVAVQLINKTIDMALEGNEKMILMLWERYYDRNFANILEERLKSKTAEDIDDSQQAIIDKISGGDLDLDYGSNLVKTLAVKRDSSVVKTLADELWEIQEARKRKKLTQSSEVTESDKNPSS